jgi:ankyrin repeat protein/mono/diheme cytochrome c family protein
MPEFAQPRELKVRAVARTFLAAAVIWVMWAPGFNAQTQRAPALAEQAVANVDYEQHVRPILASRCFGCHGPRQQQSGLRLDLRQNALRGGDYGVVIVPGKSAESKLIQRLTGTDAGLQMPPTGALPPDEIDVLRAWIDSGADMPGRAAEALVVERRTDPRVQAFFDAIAAHDAAAVRRALASDRTLAQSVDGSGTTALMHSAYCGSVELMEALLEAGADVNARNRRNATALHWAISDPAKMKRLLMKGADVNAKSVDGRTALHAAAMLPMGAPVVRLLLEVGADVDSRSIVGQTPLFAAVGASVETTRLLLDKGANPNAVSQTGATPLMSVRNSDVVSLLVARGADAAARSKRGETALADAASRGDLAAVKLLLDKGADVNAVDYRGYTPLLQAVQYDRDSPDIVKLLLERGANVHAVAEGQTALTIAARRGDTELTRFLREATAAARSNTSRR